MATKRKGKKVNRSAYSRKKVPRKMRGNKRKSLKNKTSSKKRMNRKAGMDVLLRRIGSAWDRVLHGDGSQDQAEATRENVELWWNILNERAQVLGEERVRNIMETVRQDIGFHHINSVEEMYQRMHEDNNHVPRALEAILRETHHRLREEEWLEEQIEISEGRGKTGMSEQDTLTGKTGTRNIPT